MKKHTHILVAGTLLLALSAPIYNRLIYPLIIEMGNQNMTDLPVRLQATFQKTRSACFGRFMIDVPEDALIVYGPAAAPSEIFRLTEESHRIDWHVSEKQKEVLDEQKYVGLTAKSRLLGEDSLYGNILNGTVSGQKIVIGHSGGLFYRVHSYIPVGSDLYVEDRHTDVRSVDELQEIIAEINLTARHIRQRTEDGIPPEPGVCLDGAFISENPSLTHERVTIGVRLKEFPDIHFSVEVTRNQGRLVESNALETRAERASKAAWQADPLWAAQIRKLRAGTREVNGWTGYEQLEHLPSDATDADKYHFAFVSLGHPTDPLKPNLDVELKSGVQDNRSGRVRPSLSEEEAMAVWDRLLGSIRVRPTGVRTSAAPAPVPLGTQLVTGYKCPQTGLWECADELSLAQPRTIWLEQGQSMPRARAWNPPTAWQRLTGRRTWSSVGAMWRLAAYERPAAGSAASAGPTASLPESQPPAPS